MRVTMKRGRLPLGLPRAPGARGSSAYAAFHRLATRTPSPSDEARVAAPDKENESAVALLQE